MYNHMQSRAPQIARNFVGVWNDHCQAHEELALPYIDYLIEEVLKAESLTKWQLSTKLVRMISSLTPGTAHRLVQLKFPNQRGELLKVSNH